MVLGIEVGFYVQEIVRRVSVGLIERGYGPLLAGLGVIKPTLLPAGRV